MSSYNYSIATDTANAALYSTGLYDAIVASSITKSLDRIDTDGDTLTIVFGASLSAGEQTTLTGLVNAHDGVWPAETAIPQLVEMSEKTPGGTSLLAIKKADGISFVRVTHDWTDPCTWYGSSVQVTDETLTGSGVGPYTSANSNWIDVLNGRVFQEYTIPQYAAVVKVDDVVQTSGYTIDYSSGEVTFDTSQTGTIKASYYYENGSTFILQPEAGKILALEHSELQFAKDVTITNPVNFEIWVYNPLYNPLETTDPDDPDFIPGVSSGNPLRFRYKFEKYKNIKDIINSANLGQGYIPALGGLTQDVLVFPFNYVTEIKLLHSQGAQMRIHIDGDTAFTGEWATATFYCISEDE